MELKQPLISIVTPAFNCELFLPQMIESVIAQTYTNWQLLVVDDCSSDDTLSVAMKYGRRDDRISIVGLPTRVGAAAALNCALKLARGPIIARHDADDYSMPTRLEEQYNCLVQTNTDLVSCGMMMLRGGATRLMPVMGMDAARYISDRVPKGPATPTVMARRQVYDLVGGQDEDAEGAAIGAGDSEWNFKTLLFGCAWSHVDESLYVYRQHAGQCTKTDGGLGQRVHETNQKKYAPLIKAKMKL